MADSKRMRSQLDAINMGSKGTVGAFTRTWRSQRRIIEEDTGYEYKGATKG